MDKEKEKFNSNNQISIPAKGDILIEARGLCKSYHGKKVVNNVNITAKAGEIVGLLGPNGAGKTTSFYMVMGLVRPDDGQVSFRGIDITNVPMYMRARMGMGYLAQEPSIFRKLTVEENILAILETLQMSRKERKERLDELLCELRLTHLAKQQAMTLSGGERRRLEITRALVTNPSFLMLDEPFGGVDPKSVEEVQEIALKLKDRGMGILITDHNVRETLDITDRAYLLADGEVLCEGDKYYLLNDKKAQDIYFGSKFTR